MNAPQTAIVKAAAIPALAMNEATLITVLQNSLYPGADHASIALVINYCRAQQLDPMQKPVHIVPMWDSKSQKMRDVIMPGVGLYRTQAARTGQYAGVSEPEFGPDITEKIGGQETTYPAWCRITVKRRMEGGQIAEFSAVERWKENYAIKGGKEKSVAPNAMWTRRPYAQLAKCAQAQALRMAFPEMTGAQPTADEMEGKPLDDFNTIDGATGEVIQKTQKPPYTDNKFMENLPKWRKLIEAGKQTADKIIATVESANTLTDEQKAAVRAVKKAEKEEKQVTFAAVAESLNRATELDTLDVAADLISAVSDPQQQAELTELYGRRREAMEAAS